jgi:hypothetical protein
LRSENGWTIDVQPATLDDHNTGVLDNDDQLKGDYARFVSYSGHTTECKRATIS